MPNSEELIKKIKSYNRFLNPEKLNKAYDFAVKAHKNQKRYSGDPYSIHPIAVADISNRSQIGQRYYNKQVYCMIQLKTHMLPTK